jgi:beta-lactamase superfamily II metal-dependent hydrolase
MVLRVHYGDATFLIMPEVSEKAMKTLIADNEKLRTTVLMLPSNGSAKVNTEEWIKLTAPQTAVIVAEAGNTSAMPDAIVTNTYLVDVPTFRTDEHGNIEIVTDGKTLSINRANP